MKVYVRGTEYPYEGCSIDFATVEESQATAAPPDSLIGGEFFEIYENGELIDRWERRGGRWVSGWGPDAREYGVIKLDSPNVQP